MTKAKEFRERETQHLSAELAEKQKHLFDLRTQAVTEKLENPSLLRKTRKDIARMKTILRERQLEETKTATATATKETPEPKATKEKKPAKAKTTKAKATKKAK